MPLLELLYEAEALPDDRLPPALAKLYGGPLGFERPRLFANFVASIDGVVAVRAIPGSPSLISEAHRADRFVMALLRAFADCVLIGAGTLHADRDHFWTSAHVFPEAAHELHGLREALGLSQNPELVVVSGSGRVDASIAALDGALIVTATEQREALAAQLPRAEVIVAGDGPRVDLAEVVKQLRARGHRSILCEGGPTLMGGIVEAGLLDELFLTVAPNLLGRVTSAERPGIVEQAELSVRTPPHATLFSVRRSDSHLFLRYAFPRNRAAG